MPRITRTTTLWIILAVATLGTAALLTPDTVFPALAVVSVVAAANVAADRLPDRLKG